MIIEKNVKFKHKRFNFIQAVYGELDEEASLLAVEECEKRLEELFDAINKAGKEDKDWTESKAIEMCYNKAATMQELIIFIHKVSEASACPQHPFIQMIAGAKPPRGGKED